MTLQLFRYADVRSFAVEQTGCAIGDPVVWAVGADEAGAGFPAGSQQALVWGALGLHEDEESARATYAAGTRAVPALAGAVEEWAAVLRPFSHRGEVNWFAPVPPCPAFTAALAPGDGGPFMVVTSAGWTLDDRFDVLKAIDFGTGVGRVRATMGQIDGLRAQLSLGFPGIFSFDGITITFWRDDPAMRSFAYRAGEHKDQMDRYRATGNADRSSFTRLQALAARGTWGGIDPLGDSAQAV